MEIRTAMPEDLAAIAQVEKECFPPAEAATAEEFRERSTYYKDHFWLLFLEGKLIAFVDGMVTEEENLTDEMYARAQGHNPKGAWQMIFGVNTLPAYRRRGYAKMLLEAAIKAARKEGRRGLVLTCKKELVDYYAKLGFVDEGVSSSVHGQVIWRQMRLTLKENL